uniref:Small ribosomal subunit protein uS14c n=1 Tax=Halimeda discoidea TaxID=118222 RepID=A0A1C9JB77_9CHLO|nr:ribosomal protein S14 [Halimeda discoidea]
MAKKALIERERKRQILVRKFFRKRFQLKQQNTQKSIKKLQKLPRDSSYVRLHNRCSLSGRPKGFFRDFKLSRHFLREMALSGFFPGIKKASW